MPVMIKRKDSASFVPPSKPPVDTSAMSALEAVFGDVAPEELRPGAVYGLCINDPVVIVNTKFPWVQCWKPGDTGKVVHVDSSGNAAKYTPNYDPARDTIYVIELDEPRDPRFTKMEFPRWAIELLNGVHKV